MWHKLSIRNQLLILLSSLLLILTTATMGIAYVFDKQQRKTVAIELANTLTKSLRQDMLKAILTNQTDGYADLSFRLSQFKSLDLAILYDHNKQEVFQVSHGDHPYGHLIKVATYQPQFEGPDLYVKVPLKEDSVYFGEVLYVIDIADLSSQLHQQIFWLGFVIPLELLIGLILTTWISRRYSQPLEIIAKAMINSNPTQKETPEIQTLFQNEIKVIFSGFNQMMKQIYESTKQLRYQSEHDRLTGAYNRFYIEDKIKEALKETTIQENALLSVDLRQFRLIKDSAGVAAGDELLKMVVRNCQNHLPENSILSRMSDNTFWILITDTNTLQTSSTAKFLLHKLNDFRFSWDGQAYSISACIGIAMFKPNQYTLTKLMHAVDSALKFAKSEGKNQVHLHHAEDNVVSYYNRVYQVASYLKQALSKDGPAMFQLYAQAIEPLQEPSDAVSYEVLLRMQDDKGNISPPGYFLPTAERYQLMAEIDQFVLWEYLALVKAAPHHLEKLHKVHINISGSSLNDPEFQASVKKAVTEFNFPWYKLELEITETSAVGNFNQANRFISWLNSVGIGLALDDFGTGMSSFEYLKSLPFDIVKIDGSFVKDMHTDPSDRAVIRYIQEICDLRNQQTVAEYIETEQDVKELTKIGITYGQGYYLGKPKPLTDWLIDS